MDSSQFLGYLITGIVTLGAFIGVINKFMQPINELRVVIQKLNDNIDVVKGDNAKHEKHLEKHDGQISKLERRVDKVETKVQMYHQHNDE